MAMVLTFLPSFLLSGFVYAIGSMPRAIQAVTYAIPSRYLVSLLKGVYLKGVGLSVLWEEAALLTVFGVAIVLLANRRFARKLG
jgi:ABC-2 type transport system permease protein